MSNPGKDGLATGSNPTVGRDAFGMQLHYHNGDFTDGPTAFTGTRSEASFKGLYNGNIAGWSYTSRSENGTPQTTMLSTYSYDKLNRLKQDQPYTMVNNASTITSKWSSSYSYDLDGSITSLERKDGNGNGIDNLSYAYPASGGKTINNRLNHIVDQLAPNDNGKGVVTQNPGNYSYDATGNLTGDATEGITSITWTPYNKIRELVKTNAAPATGTTTLRYLYDAAGNRVVKDYHATQNTTLTSRTWYIRDAQGTVLAIYTRKPTAGNSGSVTRTEAPIYGSSRIGQSTRTATYDATASGEATLLGTVYSRELGKRSYELVDHLGNVRATISDILVPRTATNTYDADILTLTDYYPFGMQMDTRTWEASGVAGHRYGYNSLEQSIETDPAGSHLTAKYGEYSAATGMRWNLDPKPNVSISPYSMFTANPIKYADPFLDSIFVNEIGTIVKNDKKDNHIYLRGKDGKLVHLGELGGKVDISRIYRNLLAANVKEASDILLPTTFRSYVQNKGKWDYKNNKKTIYGLGNDGATKFIFSGREMESQDIGNHHYGVVGKAYGWFSEDFMLRKAGEAQIAAGTSKKEWQPTKTITTDEYIEHGVKTKSTEVIKLPPYGDDPRDQFWIKEGFNYYGRMKK